MSAASRAQPFRAADGATARGGRPRIVVNPITALVVGAHNALQGPSSWFTFDEVRMDVSADDESRLRYFAWRVARVGLWNSGRGMPLPRITLSTAATASARPPPRSRHRVASPHAPGHRRRGPPISRPCSAGTSRKAWTARTAWAARTGRAPRKAGRATLRRMPSPRPLHRGPAHPGPRPAPRNPPLPGPSRGRTAPPCCVRRGDAPRG